ncbi:YhgE/Pip domain-containing protein [Bacillus nitroreducens]
MKRIRKLFIVLLTITLVLSPFLVTADSNEEISSSKDEVVYATLSPTGEQQKIYVVNTLDNEKAGKIVDYGSYSTLKNLTDLSEIIQKEDKVEIDAPEGKFYYQGMMNDKSLPWDISITYLLNEKEVKPDQLAGKDGKLEIKITTSANEKVNPVFYTNYLLQISLTLDPEVYQNIEAEKGMLANAGKNKQVTFTVMPEKEEELVLVADVVNFELDGINITAVPSSMAIDVPDMDEMTGDMASLSDAILQLHNGVGELKNGVSVLNNGIYGLRNGSEQFKNGMSSIRDASSDLVNGSQEMNKALEQISQSLSIEPENMNLGEFEKLTSGLLQIASSLRGTVTELETVQSNYATSYRALEQAIAAIPSSKLTEEEIAELKSSDANQEVVNTLLETYKAAQTTKGTFTNVQPMLLAVPDLLDGLSKGLTEVASNLELMGTEVSKEIETSDIASSLMQLQNGLAELSANYKTLHSGLVEYTKGVNQASDSYLELHNGIVKISDGTGDLEKGVDELHNGTGELHKSTNDLPEQMKEEIDRMISEFDKSDFEPVSFVSDQNRNVNLVQFVIKTESIKPIETKPTEVKEKNEEKSFWTRLLELFK